MCCQRIAARRQRTGGDMVVRRVVNLIGLHDDAVRAVVEVYDILSKHVRVVLGDGGENLPRVTAPTVLYVAVVQGNGRLAAGALRRKPG